jgi:copper(I)-binding protein
MKISGLLIIVLSIVLVPIRSADAIHSRIQEPADKLTVKNAWIQEGPPSQKITAGFMVIENHSSADLSLISASTDAARVVELHKMELEDGMMRMQKVDSIKVPAGGSVELKPGGYHLMVIGLTRQLKEGDEVKVKLTFSGSIEKIVTVPVKSRSSIEEREKN